MHGDATLDDLNELLREEFAWDDPHLYSFWLDGEYWGDAETELDRPVRPGERRPAFGGGILSRKAPTLREGQRLAYVFDFGDEWRVAITVEQIAEAVDPPLGLILERSGVAPPQYEAADE